MNRSDGFSLHETQWYRVPLRSGTLLHRRYIILQQIHSSKLNTVFLAADRKTTRRYIVKAARFDPLDHDSRCTAQIRLRREARVLRRLEKHQVIAPRLVDLFSDDQGVYLVMSHLPGQTLNETQRVELLDPARLIAIIARVAAILHHVHQCGYAHQDVKPANIVICDNDMPVVIDYGAAERISENMSWRPERQCTFGFASAEQIQGAVRPDNDVYSLAQTAAALIASPGPAVQHVLTQASQPSGQRYTTMLEFVDAFAAAASPSSDSVLPPNPTTISGMSVRQDRLANMRGLAYTLLISIIISVVAMAVMAHNRPLPQQPPLFEIGATATPLSPLSSRGYASLSPRAFLPTTQPTAQPLKGVARPVSVDTQLKRCYQEYQQGRVAALAQRDMRYAACLLPDSSPAQAISSTIARLQAEQLWRKISIEEWYVVSSTADHDQATLIVDKTESRRDYPLGCSDRDPAPACAVVRVVDRERFRVKFVLQRFESRWLISDAHVLSGLGYPTSVTPGVE